jgi:hypothetical protein
MLDGCRKPNVIEIGPSLDQGLTWLKEHRLLLDEGSGRGYSRSGVMRLQRP